MIFFILHTYYKCADTKQILEQKWYWKKFGGIEPRTSQTWANQANHQTTTKYENEIIKVYKCCTQEMKVI